MARVEPVRPRLRAERKVDDVGTDRTARHSLGRHCGPLEGGDQVRVESRARVREDLGHGELRVGCDARAESVVGRARSAFARARGDSCHVRPMPVAIPDCRPAPTAREVAGLDDLRRVERPRPVPEVEVVEIGMDGIQPRVEDGDPDARACQPVRPQCGHAEVAGRRTRLIRRDGLVFERDDQFNRGQAVDPPEGGDAKDGDGVGDDRECGYGSVAAQDSGAARLDVRGSGSGGRAVGGRDEVWELAGLETRDEPGDPPVELAPAGDEIC